MKKIITNSWIYLKGIYLENDNKLKEMFLPNIFNKKSKTINNINDNKKYSMW